jgi:ribosomal protein L37AE/L43A
METADVNYDESQKSAPLLMCRSCQKYAYVTHGTGEWVCQDCTEKASRVDHSQYDQPLATAATAGGRFRP